MIDRKHDKTLAVHLENSFLVSLSISSIGFITLQTIL